MFRYPFIALSGLTLACGAGAACAELPSLMPDQSARAKAGAQQYRSLSSPLGGLATLQRGRLYTSFGTMNYRVGGDGITAGFRYRGTAASAVIGYGGARLEIDWRAGGRNVRFAIATTEDDGGYRIEIVRRF